MRCDRSDVCDGGLPIIPYIIFFFFKQTIGKVYHSCHMYHHATNQHLSPVEYGSLLEVQMLGKITALLYFYTVIPRLWEWNLNLYNKDNLRHTLSGFL